MPISLADIRRALYTAAVCDALDALGYRHQSPRVELRPLTVDALLVGRARTTLWADMAHADPRPYELELAAVDSCQPDDVLVAAAGGSLRSGVWGELLSTAARNRGCAGAVVDGAARDLAAMRRMAFPVFARGACPLDSRDRQRVVDLDVPVEVGGVLVRPGDLILADEDGAVIVPREAEDEAIRRAWDKVHKESKVREAIRTGMKAAKAFARFGTL
ncbi:MAG: RraA family protein [Planctomycetes bacterium]|nr:RraA family protein [Planctomycetota bacterium]